MLQVKILLIINASVLYLREKECAEKYICQKIIKDRILASARSLRAVS